MTEKTPDDVTVPHPPRREPAPKDGAPVKPDEGDRPIQQKSPAN